jgi:hypothetical protein
MAPKRHKKQKAKQVRHHLEVKRAGEHTADGAENAERSVPIPPPAAPAAVVVEERPPALDIWPDFEEVVFPAPSADRRNEDAKPETPEPPAARRRDAAPEPPDTVPEPPRERRRQSRTSASSDNGASTTLLDDETSWLIPTVPPRDERPATAALIEDDLDDDEREAITTDALVARTTAPVEPDEADVLVESAEPVASDVPEAPTARTARAARNRRGVGRFMGRLRDRGDARPLRPAEVAGMLGAITVAIILWVPMMRQVRLSNMNDLGLIAALPAATVIPYALLIASFSYCLWRAQSKTLLMVIHTIALLVMTYAIRALYVPVPSYKVAYRHIGVSDVIGRTGSIDTSIDAYFNWPGFFSYAESLAKAAGFGTIEAFANMAPLIYNLLYLAPVLVIMRTITRDQRLVWIGIWTFYLANWVSQDYLSPQGLAYFLHLVVIAIVLRWFTRPRGDGQSQPSAPVIAGLASVLVIMAYMIPSHQLTPFATIFALFALLFARRLTARAMPIIVGFMAATWLVLMATDYLSGHGSNVTGGGAALSDTVASNVGDRVAGTAQRVFVVQGRIAFSLVFLLLALVGAFRMFRRRKLDFAHILIPASAFVLIPIQPYGGEIVFRVFLMALPFAAAFATIAVMPRRDGRFGATVPIVAAAWLACLLVTFTITRYGNERMDTFTKDEIAATQYLYNAPGVATAKRRSLLALGGSDNLPWKARAYATFQWKTLTDLEEWKATQNSARIPAREIVNAARDLMRHYPDGAYLIFTRSQAAEVDLTGASPRGSLQRVEAAVARSPWFRPVFQNADARIYVLTSSGEAKDAKKASG